MEESILGLAEAIVEAQRSRGSHECVKFMVGEETRL